MDMRIRGTLFLSSFVAGIVLIAAVLSWRGLLPSISGKSGPISGVDSSELPKAAFPADSQVDSHDKDDSGSAGGGVSKSAISALYAGVPRTRHGLPFADDPFGAVSLEEQQWLDRNGYPNAAEWKALNAADFAQLREAADGGDPMAATMIDHWKVFQEGDAGAVTALMQRGASGNAFALEMLVSALEGARTRRDPVFASAVRQMAAMRGNHALSALPDGNLSVPLTSTQRLESARRARELYQLLEDIRRSELGLPPSPPDPRPVRP